MRWPCWLGHDWGKWAALKQDMERPLTDGLWITGRMPMVRYTRTFQRRSCVVCGLTEERDL